MKSKNEPISSELLLKLRKSLLSWFQKNKRELPFRINKNAYRIWVSEIMLQQTRVAAMLPIYETFLKRFPDPIALKEASEDEVMKYWKGLGYYSRARNLKKGAALLVEKFSGEFPKDYEDALSIPGVGSYTASAVLSIAYGKHHAVLDGNVKRVLSRLFLIEQDPLLGSTNQLLGGLAQELLTPDFAGDHNEAMMELGALVCVPVPICESCPFIDGCEARAVGKEREIPVSKSVDNWVDLDLHFLFLKSEGQILLLKYPGRRFFKTIYSLPFRIEGNHPYEKDSIAEQLFDGSLMKTHSKTAKHSITNHRIRLMFSESSEDRIRIERILSKKENLLFKWVSEEDLKEEFPSSISGKLIQLKNKTIKQPDLPVGKI
ncbi:A/G-specific adenine glycosylase [Leptospira sp. 201903071]|uniref:A/G-specific adenine glycosylase n=1 Tax=Leptospira ainazelensis TaxID=2810034 RepID=UPI001964BC55|nr:A/G-specific adenine glycosylase [Leptospira ainazelensis]